MLGYIKGVFGDMFGDAKDWQLDKAYYAGFREGAMHMRDSVHHDGHREGYREALDDVRDNRIVWAEKLCSRCHISEQQKKYSRRIIG